jgi:predicted 2-oxoglutarate/Fe(II)-dependent dioxygenase YbiX
LGQLGRREAAFLRGLAAELGFEPGRQGTGYEKAQVPAEVQAIQDLRDVALHHLGVPSSHAHDCYILRYEEGSFIPPHKDDAPFGSQHWRLNAIIDAAEGGILLVNNKPIDLKQSDAYVFRPDALLHEVTPITKGTRLIFSVGILK